MQSCGDRRGDYRAALFGCSAFMAAALATQAFGQAAPDQGATLSEVIVTAQKREQSLQDVPISVTAITPDVLKANRIVNVQDLATLAPNLSVRNVAGSAGIPGFTLRGIQTVGTAVGQDREISLYLDGVYIGAGIGLAFDLPDLERIEILRGPQGTLFGRNATAGAISIVTREPSGQFSLHQELTAGNYEQFRSVTRVETPAWGPFSGSLSYTHKERQGDVKNLGAGQVWDRTGRYTGQGVAHSPKTLGDENVDGVFATVKFEPSDGFKTIYKFDWMDNHFTPEGIAVEQFTPFALGPAFGGILTALYNANPFPIAGLHRPKYVNNAFSTPGYQKVWGHNLTSTLRVNDNLSLKNILAYRYSSIRANSEIFGGGGLKITPATSFLGPVGSPWVILGSTSASTVNQFSEEFQLNYDSERVTLTSGALYFRVIQSFGPPPGLTPSPAFTAFPGGRVPVGPLSRDYGVTESYAAYAQAEVHVLPQLDVLAGIRTTTDKKRGTSWLGGVRFDSTYKSNRPSYMLGVNYKPIPDTMIYGKYATGFVSGGSYATISFAPETVKSWEAGIKSDLFDRRLRVNLAGWTARYLHLQASALGTNINRPDLSLVILDQGNLKAKGFELEVTAAPMRGLTLNGGLGYTHTKRTSLNPIFGVALENFRNWNRPPWTANLSAQYETEPLFDEARLMLRVDGSWRDRQISFQYLPVPPAYKPFEYAPAAWLVNARIALRDIKLAQGKMEAALWVKNLTDNDLPTFPLAFGTTNPSLMATAYERARTFGIDLIYDY